MYFRQKLPYTLVKKIDEMKHLPTACIVLNKHAEIIDINDAASKILNVKCLTIGTCLKLELQLYPYFDTLIQSLADQKIRLKCMNNSNKDLVIRTLLIAETENIFIFQLTEIEPFILSKYLQNLSNRLFNKIRVNK